MRRSGFSSEILCLFFIITISVLFGKVLLDVKTSFALETDNSDYESQVIDYQAYSHRNEKRIECLKDITVIKNEEDLNYFKDLVKRVDIDVKWLDEKLNSIDQDFFKDKTLVVLSIVNDNNVTSTRISDIYAKKDEIVISVEKRVRDFESTKKYTWFAVIELDNKNSDVVLDIIKN